MKKNEEKLLELFRYRWCIPVLTELHREEGSKYVTLLRRLKASDGPLRQALDHSIAKGWIVRNPGYGHPSRPEYILTPSGKQLGPSCLELIEAMERADTLDAGLTKWAMILLQVLDEEKRRFSELRVAASPITPRALSQTLKELIDCGLVVREVSNEMPAVVSYERTESGALLAEIVARLSAMLDG